jgi:predicted nuclease of predicted toxin-antitoxin system
MKLIADESFPLPAYRFLAAAGYDITAVAISSRSIADAEVMELAIREGRTILACDRDFGELIFKKGMTPPNGVIYLRLTAEQLRNAGPLILELLNRPGFSARGQIIVYDGTFLRTRKFGPR